MIRPASCIGPKYPRNPRPQTTDKAISVDPINAPNPTAIKFEITESPTDRPKIVPAKAPEPWKGIITNTTIPKKVNLSTQGIVSKIEAPFSCILRIPLPMKGSFLAKSKFQIKNRQTTISTNAILNAKTVQGIP